MKKRWDKITAAALSVIMGLSLTACGASQTAETTAAAAAGDVYKRQCMNCSGSSCMSNHSILETRRTQALEDALEQKKANVAKAQAELDAATAKKD